MAGRLAALQAELPPGCRLLAVSKGQPADRIREAVAAGQRSFAESRLQEAAAKQQELADLQDEATRLKDDPYTVERISRDTMGVAKPGEVIFKFQSYPTNAVGPGEGKRQGRSSEAMRKP